jgi:outer membrane protein
MNKLIFIPIILLVASCQSDKIGFVDNVKLMDAYQAKIDVATKYQKKSAALTKKRDSISQAFQIEAQAFQSQAQSMSQQKAQEAYAQMQQKGQMIGQQLQQEDVLLQSEGQQEMDSVVSTVKKEIQAYGKANGYSYILGGGEGGSVLYGKEAHDLTDQIVKLLNEKYNK